MMNEGYEFEINTDDFGARGLAVVDEDPSVQHLPVADDTSETDSERAAPRRARGGGRWSKKKIVIGLVVSVAMVALAIALSAGLGTSPSRTASAANGAMTYEACQAEEEEFFKSMSVETTATPTLFPTSYSTLFPTSYTAPATTESDKTPEAASFFPIYSNDFDFGADSVDDDEDEDVRRELRGESKAAESKGVAGLVYEKTKQRFGTAASRHWERKLHCDKILADHHSTASKSSKSPTLESKSSKSSSACSGKSGKSAGGNSSSSPASRSKAGKSKSSKSDCVPEGPTKTPTKKPTQKPTDSPTSKPTQDVCLSKKTVTVEESAVIGGVESAGDNGGLANPEGAPLNTRVDETDAEKEERLDGIIPEGFKIPEYDPVCDAKCFTDDVYNPLVATPMDLYNDYVHLIVKGFENPTAVSDKNNGVTNDRYGGMMIRMCFHDNTPVLEDGVVKFQPPPQYVKDNIVINPDGKKTWSGNTRYMETSGADASVLICPEERYHPNNNYDDTASRVLEAFQKKSLPDRRSLKEKYDLSYSDLLNNGCIAAVIWAATNADVNLDPEDLLNENPFVYGRRDACHTVTSPENTTTRLPLCGLSGILPGVQQDIGTIDNWYVDRGFNAYLWLIQFFTHTMMDNMADNCPLQNLVCKATQDVADAVEYIDDNEVGNDLDYFEFFTARGTHTPFELGEIIDDEAPNCVWTVDSEEKPWPMTQADCTISLDQAKDNEKLNMHMAITYFHTVSTTLEKIHALLCSLRMMASDGLYPDGACDKVMDDGVIETGEPHHFGAYFG